MFTTGIQLGWIVQGNKILTSSIAPLRITDYDTAALSTMIALGTIPGAIIAFILANKWSQRNCLLFSAIPNALCFLIFAFAANKTAYFIGRFLAGLGCGVAFTVVPNYASDIASTSIRGICGVMPIFAISLGALLPNVVMPFVDFKLINLIFVLSPICQFVFCVFIPESPYLLIQKGNQAGARNALVKLRKTNKVDTEFNEMVSYVEKLMEENVKVSTLFTDVVYRKVAIYSAVGIFAQQFTGACGIQPYTQKILESGKGFISPDIGVIICAVFGLITPIISGVLVDKFGRKLLFLLSMIILAISCEVLGLYYYFFHWEHISDYDFIPFFTVFFINFGFGIGVGSLPYLYMSELAPANVRSLCGCYLTILGCIAGGIVSYTFIPMQHALGDYSPMFMYVIFNIIFMVIVVVFLPETKGKSFSEINQMLRGNNIKADQIEEGTKKEPK